MLLSLTKRAGISLAVAAVLATSACTFDAVSGTAGSVNAEIRVINGTTTPMAVFVDGNQVIGALASATVSTALPVAEGARKVELRPIGGSTPVVTSVVARFGVPVLIGATGGNGSAARAVVLSDTAAIAPAGASKLRVVHMAANAPAIDVWRTQPDYQTFIRVMFPFAYGASSSYLQSTPGAWTVTVNAATPPPSSPQGTEFARMSVTIPSAGVRTLIILDVPGGGVKLELID